jgi:3-phenylpropionate/trans-cinnamate dioxygenase ferredoxin reductase subunit
MNIHRRQGVTFYSQSNVSSIEGAVRANRVKLESGETIKCDMVVIGAGVTPSLEVIQGTGVKVNREILVDEFCQTNIENIYAAGDVTEFYHPMLDRHIHIEHWDNARLHGIAAAQNMLGRRVPHNPIPFFWSDQYLDIQYTGFPLKWEKTLVRGNVEEDDFSVFMLDGARLVAAVCFGRWKERRACERILREGGEVNAERLADEEFSLESMLPQAQPLE